LPLIILGFIPPELACAQAAEERRAREGGMPQVLLTAVATRREVGATGTVGRIEIARLGLSAPVSEGTSERVLRDAVGHAKRTSFPGEPGNVGLAGHRNTHFRKLRNIGLGDRIRVHTPDGVFEYEVETTLIVKPDRGDLLRPTKKQTLTLVTCYPFDYVGHAPKRFIVRARQVGYAAPAGSNVVAFGGTIAP
jgi:sortase A